MIQIKKLYIILGLGGSRKDFVTGWLGTLPNFINTRWHIDLPTGGSFNDMEIIKEIDLSPELTFTQMLRDKKGIEFSDDAILNLAVSCHGKYLAENLRDLRKDQYQIIHVNVSQKTYPDLAWQNCVKNFLRFNRSIDQLVGDNFFNTSILRFFGVNNPTKEEQVTNIDNIFPRYNTSSDTWLKEFESDALRCNDNLDMYHVNYEDIFVSTGSRKLCDATSLVVPEVNHRYWDALVPFADSPEEIEFLGKIWRRTDYIK